MSEESERFLKKCEGSVRDMILSKLDKLVDNPKLGKPLTANLAGLHSLRISDYRAIYSIKKNELKILIIKVSRRKNVYEG